MHIRIKSAANNLPLPKRFSILRAVQASIGAATVAAALSSAGTSAAATITGLSPDLSVTSVPTSSLGSQGYVFYSPGSASAADIYTGTDTSPVSYVTLNTLGNSKFGDPSYSALTIGGVADHTGLIYKQNPSIGQSTPMETITLTETGVNGSVTTGAPVSEFILGVLEDNGADPSSNDMTSVLATLASGTSGTADSASLSQNVAGDSSLSNDFYLFDISGAHVGDIITIAVTNSHDNPGNVVLGGLTFDAPVPEPTGIAAVMVIGGLGALRRRAGATHK